MTFKMTKEHLYWWPVEVKVPATEHNRAGTFQVMELKMLFVATRKEEASSSSVDGDAPTSDTPEIEKFVRDWDDVIDDDGKPVPFTDKNFRLAMGTVWFRSAVYRAYTASLVGDEARTKN